MTGRRQKFPNFIEYANDSTTFQCKTEATLKRAWGLTIDEFIPVKRDPARNSPWKLRFEPYPQNLLWVYDTAKWSDEFIWRELSSNQFEFKMLLDAIINKCMLRVYVELLEKHDNHVRIHNSWLYRPCEIFPSHRSGPSLRPNEYIRLQDPLDGIYWSLGKFLRLGGEQYLRKCPVCERYFIQPTARPQTHCGDACRLQGDPNRRRANADSQKRRRERLREMLIQKDLRKVKEAKAQLRAQGIKEPGLERVLPGAGISSRRWYFLCRYEIERHGRQRDTDLTRP